jgi:hypothetical protein
MMAASCASSAIPLDQPVSELRVHATALRHPHMWLPQTSKPELRNGTATDGDPTRERYRRER